MDATPSIALPTESSHLPLEQRKRAPTTPNTTTDVVAEHREPILSTSPIFPPGSNYQVFLSFRGEDTRTGFTDHLYHSLVNAGICVFRDDNNLRVGGEIGPELHRAISESKISIPILSEMYASSKWCLEELTEVIARKKSSGHVVMPIFYKVEPSHVRHQTGSFGEAFDSLRNLSEPQVVEEWEQALRDVTSMKGWESKKFANGYEGELVKLVVEAILGELKQDFHLDIPEHLVGIDPHVEEIMRLIDANSNDIRMIGIYGMGGIGKTTLAKCIFNKLSYEFVNLSFIADVREKTRQYGIEHSQKQLISHVLKSDTHVFSVDDGINTIKSRFAGKKVLILIDDVDHKNQLDDLTRKRSWFGLGSRIIVTTRDKEVLDKAKFGVDYKYELQGMNQELSLQLFSIHAFQEDSPLSEFMVLSREIVETTGGLPLALEVIGSLLFGERDMAVWIDTLKKLRSAPDKQVQEKLKISYDALDYESKQIFLDIACFFIGSERTFPIYMWDDLKFAPRMRIQILTRKSLIKIEKNKFWMHDQLRDLAMTIIREEDYDEPKNRSRLWDFNEASNLLDTHEGSEKTRAIDVNHPCSRPRVLTKEVFEKLPNLRMLRARRVAFVGDFQNSFSELRWLQWDGGYTVAQKTRLRWLCLHVSDLCPELTNFHPEKLVILEIFSNSKISEDWAGWSPMKMPRLKVLYLRDCWALRNSPDLSACTNLEILSIRGCWELKRIHPSIRGMKSLISLNLSECSNLMELPTEMKELRALKQLVIDKTSIKEIPEWIASLTNLERLSARRCGLLARIPESIQHLVNLSNLDFSYCFSLLQIPCSARKLESLNKLDISGTSIAKLPEAIGHAKNLQELFASGCHLEGDIPSEIGNLCSLKILKLDSTSISSLPETISNLSSLQVLGLNYCAQLESLPNLSQLIHLKQLILTDCTSLEFIQDLPSNLFELVVNGSLKLEKLPNLSSLKLLSKLQLNLCPKLTEIVGLERLKSLTVFNATRCPKLFRFDGLEHLESLKYLDMSLDDDDDNDGEDQVETQLFCRSKFLEKLDVCRRNSIKMLDLTHLHSLRELRATNCKNIVELRGLNKVKFLEELHISGCPKLSRFDGLEHLESSLKYLDMSLDDDDEEDYEDHVETQLFCGSKFLEKLDICSRKSIHILDLTQSHSLRELMAANCKNLVEIRGLDKVELLEELDISGCPKLSKFDGLECLELLKYLDMSLDGDEEDDDEDQVQTQLFCKSKYLEKMDICRRNSIKMLDLTHLHNLRKLMVANCKNLVEIQGLDKMEFLGELHIGGCPKLSRFDGLEHLESLKYLDVSLSDDDDHKDKDQVETQFLNKLKFLQKLDVSRHNSIKMLDLTKLNGLRVLKAIDCKNLVEIRDLDKAVFLKELDISGCKSIERLPDISCCKILERLNINFCENLRDIKILGKFSSCRTLNIRGCHSLEKLPNLSNFENLEALTLNDCQKLVTISSFRKSRSLQYIDISGCMSITTLSNLSACKELKCLVARDCSSLTKLQGLKNLTMFYLDISGCHLMDPLPELSGPRLVLNYEAEPPEYLCPLSFDRITFE